ncbi:MAG: hypothetical protein K2N78_02515 [Oscillospiraceae bacterium]|nr:hypothetical protein [Oscillospiraceae bacterium]
MINVTYSRERWEALSRRAREKFQNARDLARAGAGLVEEKTEALRARARLEQEVRDLLEEIDLQMQAIGEMTYAAHKGRPSDDDCLRKILEYVDSLYEQLEAHQRELTAAQGMVVCGACGAANDPGYVYCHNCGQPLSK